jgi:DNA (cytosine-5)-methyltransferase 1
MKVLNLYACLGGNRLKWTDCEVTAVELDPELARMYQERFPNDTVIIGDAHQYLLDHYKEFDFIWSSPPCPSHSVTNHFLNAQGIERYPDMKLYEEIIFLQTFFKGKYCIENVKPYYEPLVPAQQRERHLYWCNFRLPSVLSTRAAPPITANKARRKDQHKKMCEFHDIDLYSYDGSQDMQKLARNLVDYEAGLTIFNLARGIHEAKQTSQTNIFDQGA